MLSGALHYAMAGAPFVANDMPKTTSTSTKPLVFWVLLLLIMTLTRPAQLPVVFLVVPYALLWGALYYTATLLLDRILLSPDNVARLRRVRHLSMIIATGGLCFIALQSIGQLTPRDVIVVSLLIVIGYFYLNRNRKSGR